MPAEAITGAMLKPSSEMIMRIAMAHTMMVATEASTAPMVRARSACRSEATPASCTQRDWPWSRRLTIRDCVPRAMPRVTLRISRRTTAETTTAPISTRSTRKGLSSQNSRLCIGFSVSAARGCALGAAGARTGRAASSAGTHRELFRNGSCSGAGDQSQSLTLNTTYSTRPTSSMSTSAMG